MSWRVVVVSKRCKLEYKLGYMICRGEEMKKIFVNEISTLMIESTAVSLTTALLCELTKNKVNIIFCDEKHNPQTQLISLYDRHDCSGILKNQLKWSQENKLIVWTEIVRRKIYNQYLFLKELGSTQSDLLKQYLEELTFGDSTNREAHSAKVYFDVLWGLGFKRGDRTFVNSALNYGYSIILSAFNREIVGDGYNTQLGIFHKNEFNKFNLSCDLMEPFRVLVDRAVFCSEETEITPDYKHYLCNILNRIVKINGMNCPLVDAISIYSKSVLSAIDDGDIQSIKHYEL